MVERIAHARNAVLDRIEDGHTKPLMANNTICEKYVLFNAAEKTVYQLDDQKRPEQFAGMKVKVMGTDDKDTDTIHVSDIQPPL